MMVQTQRSGGESAVTPRQAEVLAFIRRYTQKEGRPPSMREIGAGLGIRSTNAVMEHVVALQSKGQLVRSRGGARSLRVVGDGDVQAALMALYRDTQNVLLRQTIDRHVLERAVGRVAAALAREGGS